MPPSTLLPATLASTVDGVVTLTLAVSNPSSSPVEVEFSSGQHVDFTISDAMTNATLWVWSADKMFTQALNNERIPPNGTVDYSAQWNARESGSYIATGELVSLSHHATATLTFSVP